MARHGDGPEIFHSLQGEGASIGTPSVFVRASLCNLHCKWCDTDYTWNWENTPWKHEKDNQPGYHKFNKNDCIISMHTDEIARQIASYSCTNVILTGGEPLLQDEAWQSIIKELVARDSNYRFEVETNGTIIPSPELEPLISQYNVSPKLENSGNPAKLRNNSDTMAFFAASSKAWFKFVVADKSDLTEIEELIATYSLPRYRILLMPEGRDQDSLEKNRLWVAEACREHGFRFGDRLHIQLWGSKRGV